MSQRARQMEKSLLAEDEARNPSFSPQEVSENRLHLQTCICPGQFAFVAKPPARSWKHKFASRHGQMLGRAGTEKSRGGAFPSNVYAKSTTHIASPTAGNLRVPSLEANLSTPEEIREGRIKAGFKQQQDFARCFGIGVSTLSRWETGAQVQQRFHDGMLRTFFAIPEVRPFLQKLRGTENGKAPSQASPQNPEET
jgi:DNA-binding transcriptional regulator YiaG